MLKLALQKKASRVNIPKQTSILNAMPTTTTTSTLRKKRTRKVKNNNLEMLNIQSLDQKDNDITTTSSNLPKLAENNGTISISSIVSQFTDNISNGTIQNTLIHDPNVKLQNIEGTNFPRNTPCYICGPKGSGKTYMLSALLQYVVSKELFTRIFYIYADNVDATIHVAIPKDKLYLISKEHAEVFLSKYLRKKTKYCSWLRFYMTCEQIGIDKLQGLNIDQLLQTHVYWDNLIDETVKIKKLTSFDLMLEYCKKVIEKYQKSTIIKLSPTSSGFKYDSSSLNDIKINVGPFSENDFDMIVFDDIAQFYDIFGSTRSKSKLYKYFTITRQNRTTFYLCGQELMQLHKMFREQLGALVCMNGTDIQELKSYRFNKRMITRIEDEMKKLELHEGFLYNYNTQVLEIIKNGNQTQK